MFGIQMMAHYIVKCIFCIFYMVSGSSRLLMPLCVCVSLQRCAAQCEQGVRGHDPQSLGDNWPGGAL